MNRGVAEFDRGDHGTDIEHIDRLLRDIADSSVIIRRRDADCVLAVPLIVQVLMGGAEAPLTAGEVDHCVDRPVSPVDDGLLHVQHAGTVNVPFTVTVPFPSMLMELSTRGSRVGATLLTVTERDVVSPVEPFRKNRIPGNVAFAKLELNSVFRT